MANADAAMYQAKRGGLQGYEFFRPQMRFRAEEMGTLRQDLFRALQRSEFTLHYQPKIDLKTGTIAGVEALARWNHPTRGLVPAQRFLAAAEGTSLIVPIGAWVLRQACSQVRAWNDAGYPTKNIVRCAGLCLFEVGRPAVPPWISALASKQIVDKRGGTIRLRSSIDEKHRGNVFTIIFPVEPPERSS